MTLAATHPHTNDVQALQHKPSGATAVWFALAPKLLPHKHSMLA